MYFKTSHQNTLKNISNALDPYHLQYRYPTKNKLDADISIISENGKSERRLLNV